jgi:hypothetical protein
VQPSDAGSYSVVVSNAAGAATSVGAELTIAPPPPASRISNVSIRTSLPANETVIVGIAVAGGPRDVLVRAVGPGLATFAVSGVMADPRLDLFNGQTLVLTNDDWPASLAPSFVSLGGVWTRGRKPGRCVPTATERLFLDPGAGSRRRRGAGRSVRCG